MQRFFSNKRLALFAPFIGLVFLTLVAFGLWVGASGRIADELTARGLSWEGLARAGFPARITLEIDKPRWRDTTPGSSLVWQNQGLTLTVMPFDGGHAIIDFKGDHHLGFDGGDLRMAHQGNLMSAIVDFDGLNRASFEAHQPSVNGIWLDLDLSARAAELGLHARRAPTANEARYDVALLAKNLTLKQDNGTLALTRLDAAGTVPAAAFERPLGAGDVIVLDRVTLERQQLTLIGKGRVKLRANGYMDGMLDLDIVGLEPFIDALIEFDLIKRRDRRKLLLLGGLGAAFGGDTPDRLSLPLRFQNKRLYLGDLELGAAPRWK